MAFTKDNSEAFQRLKLKNKELEDELFRRRQLPAKVSELQAELDELAKAHDLLTIERDYLHQRDEDLAYMIARAYQKVGHLGLEKVGLETKASVLKLKLADANAEVATLKAELDKAAQLKPYLDAGLSPEQLKALAGGDARKLRERLRSKSDELEKANRQLKEAQDKAATANGLAERRQREIDRLFGPNTNLNQPIPATQPEAD